MLNVECWVLQEFTRMAHLVLLVFVLDVRHEFSADWGGDPYFGYLAQVCFCAD